MLRLCTNLPGFGGWDLLRQFQVTFKCPRNRPFREGGLCRALAAGLRLLSPANRTTGAAVGTVLSVVPVWGIATEHSGAEITAPGLSGLCRFSAF